MKRYSYTAYGLGIHSDLPLPELVPDGSAADHVFVRLGDAERERAGDRIRPTAEAVHLFCEGLGAFLVKEGREILLEPTPGVDERELRRHVLGSLFPVLLYQRGRVVLHGSAVEVGGSAVAFLGGSGWGKSTLAAALHARGHRIMADDVTPVCVDADPPRVYPGYPQLKLCSETATSLGIAFESLSRIDFESEKRALPVARDFPQAPLPLKRIYVLADGARHAVESLSSQEAFAALMQHSYIRFNEDPVAASFHFRRCANLASRVSVCRLKRRRFLAALPDLVRAIEEDLVSDRGFVEARRMVAG